MKFWIEYFSGNIDSTPRMKTRLIRVQYRLEAAATPGQPVLSMELLTLRGGKSSN